MILIMRPTIITFFNIGRFITWYVILKEGGHFLSNGIICSVNYQNILISRIKQTNNNNKKKSLNENKLFSNVFKLYRVYREDNLNKFKLLNVFKTLNK